MQSENPNMDDYNELPIAIHLVHHRRKSDTTEEDMVQVRYRWFEMLCRYITPLLLILVPA
jgi:hypothetical protein